MAYREFENFVSGRPLRGLNLLAQVSLDEDGLVGGMAYANRAMPEVL